MAERSTRRRAAIVLAGAVLGLGLGLALTLLSDEVYRATALLETSAAADPRVPASQQRRLSAEVLAESYAQLLQEQSFLSGLTPQVAAGRFDAEELAARVDAEHDEDSAVIRVTAEGPSRQEAQAVAADVISALVALVQQLSRQRSDQVQDELSRRLAQLPAGPAGDAERDALAREIAAAAASGVEQATSVRVAAAAYAPPDPVSPNVVENLAGGLLLGLVVGLGATLLRRRPRELRPVAVEPAVEPALAPEPVPEPVAEPVAEPAVEPVADTIPPRVALEGPPPESPVAGTVSFRLQGWDDESGIAALELLVSDGGPDWRPLARVEASTGEAEWDTATVADGVYWLSAVAHDCAGHAAATEPLQLLVRNAPEPRLSSAG